MLLRWKKTVSGVNVLIVLVCLCVCLNDGYGNSKNAIKWDYACFRMQDSCVTDLEIYCEFANADLQFVKNDSEYTAEAEVVAVLYDERDNFVNELSTEQTIHEMYYNLTTNSANENFIQFNFLLETGQYKLELFFTDKNTNKTYKIKKKINVKSFNSDEMMLSDIQIASMVELSEERSNFVKNGAKIIPNPSRIFDSNSSRANFYFEIYNIQYSDFNKTNSFTMSYVVKNEKKDTIFNFSRTYSKPDKSISINFPVPINTLDAGEYRLELEITDDDTKDKAYAKTTFIIYRSPMDLRFVSFDKAVDMLRMIATNKEIKKLKKVSQQNRQVALKNFWKSKDPTPGTLENEYMVEFYSRINYVNKAFEAPGKEGWKTDRGKIYIRFGTPDTINRATANYGWEKYEMWIYHEQNKRYVFVDKFGFGDYNLVNDRLSYQSNSPFQFLILK